MPAQMPRLGPFLLPWRRVTQLAAEQAALERRFGSQPVVWRSWGSRLHPDTESTLIQTYREYADHLR